MTHMHTTSNTVFLSLTVLFTIGHIMLFGLEHGRPFFMHYYTYSALLNYHTNIHRASGLHYIPPYGHGISTVLSS